MRRNQLKDFTYDCPHNAVVIWILKQYRSKLIAFYIPDCTDSNGVLRPHNSTWTSADSCTVYSCSNGVISGRVIRCSVPPDYTPDCVPVYTAGVCCPDFECIVIRPQGLLEHAPSSTSP